MGHHVLAVVRRPAAAGDRPAAVAEGVDADRQGGLRRGGEDRPEAAVPERVRKAAQHRDLHEVAGARPALDLGDRRLRVLVGGADGAAEPGLPRGPALDLPGVDRPAERNREIDILERLGVSERNHHPETDIVRVEMLLAHKLEVGAGLAAAWGIGVAPHRHRLALRVLHLMDEPLPRQGADVAHVRPPALGEVREEVELGRARSWMDVAVGDCRLRGEDSNVLGAGPGGHAHTASPFLMRE